METHLLSSSFHAKQSSQNTSKLMEPKVKIIKIIFCALTLFISSGCANSQTIQSDLINYLKSDNPNNVYSACTILGSIQLDKNETIEIKNIFDTPPKTKISKICSAYILSKKMNEKSYNLDFINLFPVGSESIELLKTHEQLGYPITLSSPLVEHLSILAFENDTAFTKLAALSNYADGAQGESILTNLSKIYCYSPNKIEGSPHISKNNLHFIELISKDICK